MCSEKTHSFYLILFVLSENDGFLYAKMDACGTDKVLYFRWDRIGPAGAAMHLLEPSTGRCVAAESVPTAAAPRKRLVLTTCTASLPSMDWFCNEYVRKACIYWLQFSTLGVVDNEIIISFSLFSDQDFLHFVQI